MFDSWSLCKGMSVCGFECLVLAVMYVALETVQHEPHCHQMAAGIGSPTSRSRNPGKDYVGGDD